MANLINFIENHTKISNDGIDIFFAKIEVVNNPKLDEFIHLIRDFKGNNDLKFVFNESECSYVKIGSWFGSQEVALKFMVLGTYFDLWNIMTPNNVMPGMSDDIKRFAAEHGLITIKSTPEQIEKINDECKKSIKMKILTVIGDMLDDNLKNIPDEVVISSTKSELIENKIIIGVEFKNGRNNLCKGNN